MTGCGGVLGTGTLLDAGDASGFGATSFVSGMIDDRRTTVVLASVLGSSLVVGAGDLEENFVVTDSLGGGGVDDATETTFERPGDTDDLCAANFGCAGGIDVLLAFGGGGIEDRLSTSFGGAGVIDDLGTVRLGGTDCVDDGLATSTPGRSDVTFPDICRLNGGGTLGFLRLVCSKEAEFPELSIRFVALASFTDLFSSE